MECQHYPALHFLIYSHHSQPWFQESLQSSLFAPWSSMLCLRGRGNRWGGPGEPRGHGTQLGLSGGGGEAPWQEVPGCAGTRRVVRISWDLPSKHWGFHGGFHPSSSNYQRPSKTHELGVGRPLSWGRFGMGSGCVLRMPIPVLSRSERSLRSQHSKGTLLLGRLRTHTERSPTALGLVILN